MSSSPFAPPAQPSGGLAYSELSGSLLLIDVLGQETGVNTVHGPKDPIRANVAVLDGPKQGETHEDTLIFPLVLISQLRSRVGQKVLGRLGTGTAKPGQNPPWMLNEATPQDQQVGVQWLNSQVQQPAPAQQAAPQPQQPTAQQQWGQQPQQGQQAPF